MKRFGVVFLLAIFLSSFALRPASADGAAFSLVNGSYSKNIEGSLTHDWVYFWQAMRLDFVQSSANPTLYEAYAEASAADSANENLDQHRISGWISAAYDSETGLLTGEYEFTHVAETVPQNKYQANYGGTITSTYAGTIEQTLQAGTATFTLSAAGDWTQTVTGTPHGHTPEPGMNFTSRWGFSVEYRVEGTIPGKSCSPTVMGLDGLQPGDTLSPSATYFDAAGAEIDIIQERWLINGVETPSIVWDGQAVTLELQWTCPDHTAYTAAYSVAVYSGPTAAAAGTPLAGEAQPPSAVPTNERQAPANGASGALLPNEGGGLSPLGLAGIIAGGMALAGGIGLGLRNLMKPPAKPAPPPPPFYNPAQSVLPSPTVGTTHAPPPQSMQPSFPPQAQSPAETGTATAAQEAAQLSGLRDEMIRERERIKEQWRQTRDAVEKLKTLKKKNMLKFLMKQGLEVNDWILNSPVDAINKMTIDPAMEKVFEKHDTSQDGNIIVSLHNRILSLEAEMSQMVNETKHLNSEIAKIDQKLKKAGVDR